MRARSEIPWTTRDYPIGNSTPYDGISWTNINGSTIDHRGSMNNISGQGNRGRPKTLCQRLTINYIKVRHKH